MANEPRLADIDFIGEFDVQPTELRFGAAGDYLVQVGSEIRARLGRSAVLVPAGLDALVAPRPVVAKVALNVHVAPGDVHVDQTLRDAMLVQVGDRISLSRIPDESWWRVLLDEMFKPKRLWLYSYRSFPRDMEKDLCGLDADTTAILGLDRRDRVRVEAVRWNTASARYTVNAATPSVFELSPADAEYTRDEVREQLAPDGAAWLELGEKDVFRADDRDRPRLPFVRLDADISRMVANTDIADRRIAQEEDQADENNSLAEPDRLSRLAPVRLSVSLPHAVMARAAYVGLNAGIGILATVIAAAQINGFAGVVVGVVSLAVLLPLSVFFDIQRKVS